MKADALHDNAKVRTIEVDMSEGGELVGAQLEQAVRDFARELQAKLSGPQGGVPTFFDNYWITLIEQLSRLGPADRWDEAVKEADGPAGVRLSNGLVRLRGSLRRRAQGRLVSLAERRRVVDPGLARIRDVGDYAFLLSQGMPHCMSWKGRPVFKTCFDASLYPMMLWDLRPATVLELGSGTGSSAVWLLDQMRAQGHDGRVISLDIRRPSLEYPGVSFLEGDCRQLERTLGPELLAQLPRPWLVIEDAHVEVQRVLEFFHPHLHEGDYLVVEDSIDKREPIDAFMADHGDDYRLDTHYTDFFGLNGTSAVDSIFVRS